MFAQCNHSVMQLVACRLWCMVVSYIVLKRALIIIMIIHVQDRKSPIDIAQACIHIHPKAIKVLTKSKYGSLSLPWKRNRMRSSSSCTGLSSRRSESTNSASSFASRSSACSDIPCQMYKNKMTYNGTRSISENDVNTE